MKNRSIKYYFIFIIIFFLLPTFALSDKTTSIVKNKKFQTKTNTAEIKKSKKTKENALKAQKLKNMDYIKHKKYRLPEDIAKKKIEKVQKAYDLSIIEIKKRNKKGYVNRFESINLYDFPEIVCYEKENKKADTQQNNTLQKKVTNK